MSPSSPALTGEKPRFLRMAIVLGLVTAVGPFAIDMYLPAMPSMGVALNASPTAVQMSLMIFFVTIGACQLVYGPLSDILGRKIPIYGGLCIFTLGSIGCALAPNIQVLLFFRVVQALGACAGMVIPRAVVRDLYTGADATKLMSLLMLVMSVSPLLAPLTGSIILAHWDWRAVFATLTIAAAVAFLLTATQLKETRPKELRQGASWGGAFLAYLELLRDPIFVGLSFVSGFAMATFFVYLGSASFVFINHFGLTPTEFSLCFAINAASFFGFTQMTAMMTRKFGLVGVIRVGVTGFAVAMVGLGALTLAGVDSLPVMMVFIFVAFGFLGLVLPTTAVLSLENHGAIAGTASALLGALQMVTGAGVSAVAGIFFDGSAEPMILALTFCAVAAFSLATAILGRVKGPKTA